MQIYGAIGLVIAALSAVIYLQNDRIEDLVSDLSTAREANKSLERDKVRLEAQAIKNQEAIDKWRDQSYEIQRETDALEIQLQQRRKIEERVSFLQPYQAGGDADARRRDILMRFTGASRESDSETGEDQGGDSPRTDRP